MKRKRKTAEKDLYLTRLYKILIFVRNERLNCFFEGGRGGRVHDLSS